MHGIPLSYVTLHSELRCVTISHRMHCTLTLHFLSISVSFPAPFGLHTLSQNRPLQHEQVGRRLTRSGCRSGSVPRDPGPASVCQYRTWHHIASAYRCAPCGNRTWHSALVGSYNSSSTGHGTARVREDAPTSVPKRKSVHMGEVPDTGRRGPSRACLQPLRPRRSLVGPGCTKP